MRNKVMNIFFCGTGGQGVLTASEICAVAAVVEGLHAKKSEVHGMSQRGGSVESHVRFGQEVFSPLIPYGKADILVAFDRAEAKRLSGILSPEGIDLTSSLDEAERSVPEKKYLNTYLLGVLSSLLEIKEESWHKAFRSVLGDGRALKNIEIFNEARRRTR